MRIASQAGVDVAAYCATECASGFQTVTIPETEDGDAARVGELAYVGERLGALGVISAGDDEQGTTPGELAECVCDGDDGVPETEGVSAGRLAFGPVEVWRRQGGGDSGAEQRGVGRNVVGCADKRAVDRVDGDVVSQVKRFGDERGEAFGEVLEQFVLIAAGVEQDGEADGVVSGNLHLGGMKSGARVEADLKLVQRDKRDGLSVRGEDQGWDLDEIRIDVERIEVGIERRLLVLNGILCDQER